MCEEYGTGSIGKFKCARSMGLVVSGSLSMRGVWDW